MTLFLIRTGDDPLPDVFGGWQKRTLIMKVPSQGNYDNLASRLL